MSFDCVTLDSVQDGSNALHIAAKEGHSRVVEMLLEANADLDVKNNVRIPCYVLSYPYCSHVSYKSMNCGK